MFLTLTIFSYYIINSVSSYLNKNEQVDALKTANMVASLSYERDYVSTATKSVAPGFEIFLSETLKIPHETRVIITNDQAEIIFDSFNIGTNQGAVQSTKSVMTAL